MAYIISGIKPNVGKLKLYSKPVGIRWKTRTFDLFTVRSVAYGNGLFVAVGNGIATSTDGINWSKINGLTLTNPLNKVIYVNGKFSAIGDLGSSYSSTNGITWSNNSFASTYNHNTLIYANGYYVTLPQISYVYYSTNGVSWNQKLITSSTTYGALTYFNNRFIAGGTNGSYSYASPSPTGTWQLRGSGNVNTISYYANSGTKLISTLDGTDAYGISTTGLSWEFHTSPISSYKILFANNKFFVSNATSIYGSDDGLEWTPHNTVMNQRMHDVCYGNGIYVGCANNQNIIYTMSLPE